MARKHSGAGAGTRAKLMTPVVKPAAFVPAKGVADDSRATIVASSGKGRQARQGLIVNASTEPIELSSDSDDNNDNDEDEDDDDEDEEIAESADIEQEVQLKKNNNKRKAANEECEDEQRARTESPAPPTFGDLMQATSVTVDVAAMLAQGERTPTRQNPQPQGTIAPSSLATVLAQALRTDDRELLESCLQVTDLSAVRGTIQRLDSRLAIILLGKLADRMHRRPGRVGSLMVWVQWTMVSHGGALAGNRGAVQKLAGLQRVLEERARGLPSLLALKGKLDLLEGQMQLRQAHRAGANGVPGGDEGRGKDEEERDVVYIEGDEHRRRRIEAGRGALANGVSDKLKALQAAADGDLDSEDENEEDIDDDGLADLLDSGDDEDDDDESEVEEDDDEAVEESSEDEVDHDDMDEDDESEEEAPPAKKRR